jgi:hypothetical protein
MVLIPGRQVATAPGQPRWAGALTAASTSFLNTIKGQVLSADAQTTIRARQQSAGVQPDCRAQRRVEHHLFPSMPRPNLRRAQALIEAFCQRQSLPYCQASLAGSYAQALRHLNAVGRAAHPVMATSPVVQP